MARRRRRRSGGDNGTLFLIALGGLLVVVGLVVIYWRWVVGFLLLATALYMAPTLYRRKRRRDAEREAAEEREANRQAWRALTYDPGPFSVVLSGLVDSGAEFEVGELLSDVPELREQSLGEIHALIERAVHIKPQTIAEGVAQHNAVELKEALEWRGAKVRIRENGRRSSSKREPIPASVRREVWNRDGGRCVDCGSRERLEYDHIIPVSKGGSNTARNIQLLCESCNRKKGAQV